MSAVRIFEAHQDSNVVDVATKDLRNDREWTPITGLVIELTPPVDAVALVTLRIGLAMNVPTADGNVTRYNCPVYYSILNNDTIVAQCFTHHLLGQGYSVTLPQALDLVGGTKYIFRGVFAPREIAMQGLADARAQVAGNDGVIYPPDDFLNKLTVLIVKGW